MSAKLLVAHSSVAYLWISMACVRPDSVVERSKIRKRRRRGGQEEKRKEDEVIAREGLGSDPRFWWGLNEWKWRFSFPTKKSNYKLPELAGSRSWFAFEAKDAWAESEVQGGHESQFMLFVSLVPQFESRLDSFPTQVLVDRHTAPTLALLTQPQCLIFTSQDIGFPKIGVPPNDLLF